MDLQGGYAGWEKKKVRERMNADVVVVGAGPAGSTVAGIVASEGLDVMVLEGEPEIGRSPCAGYVACMDFPDVKRGVVQSKIDEMRTYFPLGAHVDFPINGFNVNRNLFDRELASNARGCGAEFHTDSRVVGLIEKTDGYSGVRTRNGKKVNARVIVGADGPSSIISRFMGFRNDVAISVQYEVHNCEVDPRVNEIYFNVDYAPGCYVWIFPTGEDSARVGLALRPHLADKKAIEYLNDFIEKHPRAAEKFRKSSTAKMIAGIIPVGGLHDRICMENVLLVGDSAGMADPITGAGIGYSMLAGKLAARAIVKAIEKDDLSLLRRYELGFRRIMGSHYEKSSSKRELMDSLTDNNSLERNLPMVWVTFKEYWH
jgi:digeranylgeranylglycerophospholipid reductase